MASINKVILIGNLGKDPELRYTPSGAPVTTFSLATTERWNDKGGQRQEKTEWHNIVIWGKMAEIAHQYLKKGRTAYIEGRLTPRSWDDKDGNKRYRTEIVANQMQFLGGGGSGNSSGNAAGDDIPPPPPMPSGPDYYAPSNTGPDAAPVEDDLPF